MPHNSYSRRLEQSVRIANNGARLALEYFHARSSLDISTKSPGQAVTDADLAVEAQIRADMGTTFPGELIVGEEFGGVGGPEYWTLDPIDGTANFLNGSPLWGVAMGHMTDGAPDLGVIVLPLLDLVIAAEGTDLFVNGASFTRTPPPIPTISLGQPNDATLTETLELHAVYRKAGYGVYHWRCSAVSLAWAGIGQISGHLHSATTLWDSVPGAAICQASGLDTRMGKDSDGKLWIKAGDAALHRYCDDLWSTDDDGGA